MNSRKIKMSRIHPSSENKSDLQCDKCEVEDPIAVSKHKTLTVWKRSSMSFQGTDGFTVYDCHGGLAFRVDNYSRNNNVRDSLSCSTSAGNGSGALILMDGNGKPLLTLKPQMFKIQNQWNGCIYREDDNKSSKSEGRIFIMRRPTLSLSLIRNTKNHQAQCEAEVYLNHHNKEPEPNGVSRRESRQPDYRIEGSFWKRNCKIRSTTSGEVAAKIMRKIKTSTTMMSGNSSPSTIMLSEEVFTLEVAKSFDPQLIMAFVVILDRICFKPFFTPLICS